ncbi:MAG: hypothetical protein U0704_03285 [Candidatus Eisenbacteria bacterium]
MTTSGWCGTSRSSSCSVSRARSGSPAMRRSSARRNRSDCAVESGGTGLLKRGVSLLGTGAAMNACSAAFVRCDAGGGGAVANGRDWACAAPAHSRAHAANASAAGVACRTTRALTSGFRSGAAGSAR